MKKLAILAVAALFVAPSLGCHHCGDWFGGWWSDPYGANYCNDCCTTAGYGGCDTCTSGGDIYAPVLPQPAQTYPAGQ